MIAAMPAESSLANLENLLDREYETSFDYIRLVTMCKPCALLPLQCKMVIERIKY